jgi:hypothetical protein
VHVFFGLTFNKKRKLKNAVNVGRFLHAFICKAFRFCAWSVWSPMGGGAGASCGSFGSKLPLIKNENRRRLQVTFMLL